MGFPTYKSIVEQFETACNAHLAIHTFKEGSIDKLDSSIQNVEYPYAFLRPLQSTGMVLNTNGQSGLRSLTFELYMLDIPALTDDDVLKIQSDTEIYVYDIISYFNLGNNQREEYITLNNITPIYEAFNDRLAGWSANITYNSYGTLDYCNFPQL